MLLLLLACGQSSNVREPPVADEPLVSETRVDWVTRSVSLRPNGPTVNFCDGEGPLLCVERDGELIGAIELLRIPVRGHDLIREALEKGATEQAALEAAAADFFDAVQRDRRTAHGSGYRLVHEGVVTRTVAGEQGLRSAVRGEIGGRAIERIVQYTVIIGDTMYLLAMNATDREAPGSREGEFSLEQLSGLAPVLDQIAAASRVTGGGDPAGS